MSRSATWGQSGTSEKDAMKVVVVGARRHRQGIGQFVAGWFADLGCEVCGIVGSRPETTKSAQSMLRAEYGIDCRAYLDITEALQCERPDVVALCTPIPLREKHLPPIVDADIDCLCEKPLWWSDTPRADAFLRETISRLAAKRRLLRLITQWPQTLATFFDLYPDIAGQPVRRFDMHLSPITDGPDMVVDCASHPISMLRALVGGGTVESCACRFDHGDRGRLRLDFTYRHAAGETQVGLEFAVCHTRPAPAGFAINGHRVEREVDLEGYVQYFRAGDRRRRLPDPTRSLIADFLERRLRGETIDANGLIEDHESLVRLYETAIYAQ